MTKSFLFGLLLLALTLNVSAQQSGKNVRFAFLTDAHMNRFNYNASIDGFRQALETVKTQNVDFILIGGDMIDVWGMGDDLKRPQADSMYTMYKGMMEATGLPYYPTIGNHDTFYDKQAGYTTGDELFKNHFKESYYSFEKGGIHFIVLNSVKSGLAIDPAQLEWLKTTLATIPSEAPIVVSTHVPVYSLYYPVVEGKFVSNDVIGNYKELLKAFEGHNLKLVLQGHQHLYEEIKLQGVQYITAGAVCANWWKGPFCGTEEGYLVVEINDAGSLSWHYYDYGWEAKR